MFKQKCGLIEPYNGLLDMFDVIKAIKRNTYLKKNCLFYTNACGERFWVKYLGYYAIKMYEKLEKVDYMWSDAPLAPLSFSKRNKIKEFYKWSSQYLKKRSWGNFTLITDEIVQPKKSFSSIAFEVLEEISRLDYCYLNKIETANEGYRETELYKYRMKVNKDFASKFEMILEKNKYDFIVIMNGCLFENAIALKIAKEKNIKVITIEIGEKLDRILLADDNEAWCFNSKMYFEKFKKIYSQKKYILESLEFLNNRKQPKLGENNASQFQKAALGNIGEIKERLGIYDGMKIALACTNVAWDSAVLGKGRAFSSQENWLKYLIHFFKNKKDWFLIIRIHPHEKVIGTNAPVGIMIKEYLNENSMSNIAVVGDGVEINTYSLAEIARVGLVYSSSIGMEMAIDGLPVVTAAKVHYSGLGFTLDPESSEEYGQILESIDYQDHKVNIDLQLDATTYYGIYHNQIFKKAPWNWGDYQKNGFVNSFMTSSDNESNIFDILASGNIYA